LGIVGPTLAMSGNGQGTVSVVGKAVPLVFVFGAIGIALIGHGFIRLTQRYSHAGSSYALVGLTIGKRAGFISGFAVMVTYVFFAICCLGAVASFLNAFLAAADSGSAHPPHAPWVLVALIAAVIALFLNTRDLQTVARALLAIEGLGIVCMTILTIVILAKGGAHSTGIDWSTFSLKGNNFSTIMGAVVAAFLSWAGFEGCAALGQETDDPTRNIPRALAWSVALTAVLFIMVMFAQTIGYGTNAAGLHTFATQGNSLTTLGKSYIGTWFSLVISFAAVVSAFACHLASVATSGRLMWVFSRDGLGPKSWTKLSAKNQPLNAIMTVTGISMVLAIIGGITKHPVVGTGDAALDYYFYYATIGAMTLMFAYFMMELGTIKYLLTERKDKAAEVILPIIGAVLMILVFYYNVKSQTQWTAAPFIAFMVLGVGLLITLFLPGLADKVAAGLSSNPEEAGPVGKDLLAPGIEAHLPTSAE
jgi:amino acid transporter